MQLPLRMFLARDLLAYVTVYQEEALECSKHGHSTFTGAG